MRESPQIHVRCLVELNRDFASCEDTVAQRPEATLRSSLFSLTAKDDFEEVGSHEQEMDTQYSVHYSLVLPHSTSTHRCTIGSLKIFF